MTAADVAECLSRRFDFLESLLEDSLSSPSSSDQCRNLDAGEAEVAVVRPVSEAPVDVVARPARPPHHAESSSPLRHGVSPSEMASDDVIQHGGESADDPVLERLRRLECLVMETRDAMVKVVAINESLRAENSQLRRRDDRLCLRCRVPVGRRCRRRRLEASPGCGRRDRSVRMGGVRHDVIGGAAAVDSTDSSSAVGAHGRSRRHRRHRRHRRRRSVVGNATDAGVGCFGGPADGGSSSSSCSSSTGDSLSSVAGTGSAVMEAVVSHWPVEQLVLEQRADPVIGPIVSCLLAGLVRPDWKDVDGLSTEAVALWRQWPRLSLQNGLLVRRFAVRYSGRFRWQIVWPASLRRELIDQMRDTSTSGSRDRKWTSAAVAARAYWPTWAFDVASVVRGSSACTERRRRDDSETSESVSRSGISDVGVDASSLSVSLRGSGRRM